MGDAERLASPGTGTDADLGWLLDDLVTRVNQIDKAPERAFDADRQILVARARPLAQESVVRLESLCGAGVIDDGSDAATQPLHDLVVFLFPDRHAGAAP